MSSPPNPEGMSPSPYRAALVESWPLMLPAWPFALVLGVVIVESPIDAFIGWSSSWIVFAGAAQLTLVSLLAAAAGPASAVVSALVVNARHLMYSAALSPVFRAQPRWFRTLAPYFLIDQLFALAIHRTGDPPGFFRKYYLTVGVVFWATWQIVVGIGVAIGTGLPAGWALEFAVPVLFVGLAVIGMVRRPAIVAGLVGFAMAVVAGPLPNRSGLLAGALAGVVAGTVVDREPV